MLYCYQVRDHGEHEGVSYIVELIRAALSRPSLSRLPIRRARLEIYLFQMFIQLHNSNIFKGYLLTRETMRRLVEKGLDQNVCNTTRPGSADDFIIGMRILSDFLKIKF